MAAVEQKKVTPFRGSVHQELGTIVSAEGASLTVETDAGTFDARVASSCLLTPELGDHVLVAVPARGEAFVLAVLVRREPDAPAQLHVDAPDLRVALPRGRIEMLARDGIRLMSQDALSIVARSIGLDAVDGRLSITRLVAHGKEVVTRAEVLDGVFGVIETAAERLTQRLGRSERFVEETDTTRAADVDVRAEQSLLMRAKDAVVHARRLFKADGEQVHIG